MWILSGRFSGLSRWPAYVLEINGNPCISPDSGFIAAAAEAGLTPTEVVKQIIKHLNNSITYEA
jgi:hypothetical protein